MFEDDGLWPCKCSACGHEWYTSIVAIRADAAVSCSACGGRNSIAIAEFDSAVIAARAGRYDFSYLVRIPPQLRSGAAAYAGPAGSSLARKAGAGPAAQALMGNGVGS